MVGRKVSKKQFIEALEEFQDSKTDKEIAVILGITPEWFSTLLRRYRVAVRDYTKDYAQKKSLRMTSQLCTNAIVRSDTKAAQIVLEMAEAYTPRQDIRQETRIELGVVVLPAKLPAGGEITEASTIQLEMPKTALLEAPGTTIREGVDVQHSPGNGEK